MTLIPLVKELMIEDYPKIDKDDTLQHALKIMEKYDMDRVLAFEKKKLVGILTKKDVVIRLGTLRTRSITPSHLYVSSVMTGNPLTIEPEVTLIKAARIMLDKRISSLPVISKDKVIGLLTKREVAKVCLDKSISVPTRLLMSYNPITLKLGDRIIHARQIVISNNISILPVVENGRPVGLITVDEVANALAAFHDIVPAKYRKERIMHLLVDDVMRRPIKVHLETPLYETTKIILDKNVKGVIVINDEDIITGVITLTDITRYVASEFKI